MSLEETKKPPPIPPSLQEVSPEKPKKPWVMKILVNFFFVFYFLAGFFSAYSAVLGTIYVIALCSFTDALQVYGAPVFMFVCASFIRSWYERGQYLKACLAMLPAVFIIFFLWLMWARSYGPLR